ncbi:ATP-dependent helicase [Bacteroides intestinalis]|uniref:DNA 3'-5' helicase II n=1 Tax=Bacteroides intestinalis TaxID=329854 RepID=A0A412YG66_9BACE|nr:ATP-dependent helicase [Bacteroides intestinalis]RGV56399.1 ATP-dependent helicase [Bacteroides intestinalis]RHA59400.1 ATP-dependent helicase [Bacteroides intestinalis]
MFERLSIAQRTIVDCPDRRIVVKACPGSGKTFSVTARLARLLSNNELNKHQGVAAISFTHTACDEIRGGIQKFGVSSFAYPHFIGTIDSFINNYIFLPYGHLFMRCNKRPEIVGTEYYPWFSYDATIRNYDRTKIIDPNYFFDKVSFGLNDTLLRLEPYQVFNFGKTDWDNPYKKDGNLKKAISDLIKMKETHFRSGKANQADANYIAYKILIKYPAIARNLAQRFPILIIDEAQDTTAIQMAIIDILDRVNINSILLVGDPDQAIFEWNTAEPALFMAKYNNPTWTSLELTENRRSSSNICHVNNRFFNNNMVSVSEEDADYPAIPSIIGHSSQSESINQIKNDFINECQRLGIREDHYTIVYRGRKFGETHFGLMTEYRTEQNEKPWVHGYYYVRDLVQGKYLINKGAYRKGFALIERGYHKMQERETYISVEFIRNKIKDLGFRYYRNTIFQFIRQLPDTNCTLNHWITQARNNGLNLCINRNRGNSNISNIFHEENIATTDTPKYLRTIHSVKGMTVEGLLVFLTKKDVFNYATLLPQEYNTLTPEGQEQMRIVYVACTRPKKLLWIAVPVEDAYVWTNKLFG